MRAVDGVDFDVFEGRTLGVVGESGCGKSVTARSILGIVEAPGRVVGGQILLRRAGGAPPIDLLKLPPDERCARSVAARSRWCSRSRWPRFSQYYTIGNQIIEAIRLHMRLDAGAARTRAIELLDMVGVPQPRAARR